MPGIAEGFAVAGVKKAAQAAAKDIYSNSKSLARNTLDKLLVEFGAGFNKYLNRNYERCRYVKTLLHRIDPIRIETAYVDPSFEIKKDTVAGADFLFQLSTLKRIVVTGLGGSGKSMFMKHTHHKDSGSTCTGV